MTSRLPYKVEFTEWWLAEAGGWETGRGWSKGTNFQLREE